MVKCVHTCSVKLTNAHTKGNERVLVTNAHGHWHKALYKFNTFIVLFNCVRVCGIGERIVFQCGRFAHFVEIKNRARRRDNSAGNTHSAYLLVTKADLDKYCPQHITCFRTFVFCINIPCPVECLMKACTTTLNIGEVRVTWTGV